MSLNRHFEINITFSSLKVNGLRLFFAFCKHLADILGADLGEKRRKAIPSFLSILARGTKSSVNFSLGETLETTETEKDKEELKDWPSKTK